VLFVLVCVFGFVLYVVDGVSLWWLVFVLLFVLLVFGVSGLCVFFSFFGCGVLVLLVVFGVLLFLLFVVLGVLVVTFLVWGVVVGGGVWVWLGSGMLVCGASVVQALLF
ncbi:hypothetical protein, partial [Pseudomonas syringae group genomosp. 7]|uniref:hypothetical protein n=1 Tax=Pseudomonas syringae group genomosp. 7 TaxID=251699 RepID=UPI00376F88B9